MSAVAQTRRPFSPAMMICALLALTGLLLGCMASAHQLKALGVIVLYAGCCGLILNRHARRKPPPPARGSAAEVTLVVWASQTGYAEQLARQTTSALAQAGVATHSMPLSALAPAQLADYRRALFIVSTTGEGDAPDEAASFMRQAAHLPAGALAQLEYGLLALGDRSYRHFCAFGHELAAWLEHHGARTQFDLIEVDNADAGALRHWQQQLSALAGGKAMADWEAPQYADWLLQTRQWLNAGSAGDPVFLLSLAPAAGVLPAWQAGDIAEVGPCHAPEYVQQWLAELGYSADEPVLLDGQSVTLAAALATRMKPDAPLQGSAQAQIDALPRLAHREYSIASIPADGTLDLLVRQARHPDPHHAEGFRPGLASGWLTRYAPAGGPIALRIRNNRSFHPPADDRPLILIGNGTGLAGLRAHLKTRAARGHHRNWLIFGERNVAHDALLQAELAAWQNQGVIARLDRIWSRDGDAIRYVQDQVSAAGADLIQWVEDGAAVYVCGSQQGMAAGVHRALLDLLGEDWLHLLAGEARYQRDVY
ncbi:flavodoxin domain-containing protein [Silvimonas iriomotensis]|uniref:NADPH--hemoprotein reductase n=1 Tax=Silvimonas iriomotensis TaxID=449662 RepID=A0ABQ2P929_9NEIS|nr:sulfite reductase flavoprotein subunit alpha [Silvimonas iriomotensis]GGP21067.1 sulfite reductase [Silvimonas iriomotensis]